MQHHTTTHPTVITMTTQQTTLSEVPAGGVGHRWPLTQPPAQTLVWRQLSVVGPAPKKRRKRHKTTLSLLQGIQRQIAAVGRRVAAGDVDGTDEDDLAALLQLSNVIEEQATLVVVRMRERGMTDGEIGDLLGVTKQAVQKRWPRTKEKDNGQ